jgi:flagellar motor switch protein FliG
MLTTSPKAPKKTEAIDLTGIQKAAILLVVMGDDSSADIVKHLSEDEVQLVGREIARVGTITAEIAEAVLEEYYQLTSARQYVIMGGIDYAKNMLNNAFGPDVAKRLIDRLMLAMGGDAASFDAIQKSDPQQLAKFLHNEHPQTIALVLSHLNSSAAAALLSALPPSLRGDVSARMASLDEISPEVISKIAAVIAQKLNALGEFSRESFGGVRAVAEMLNRLDSETAKEILNSIESDDAGLVETIRHLMFVFEDILLVDINAIKEVLARVDRKVLTVALKGTGDQLKNHFLQCMSLRGADMLREDMESMGPVKIKDVEAAQQQIISVVRLLEAEGVVSLRGTVGEQYVV